MALANGRPALEYDSSKDRKTTEPRRHMAIVSAPYFTNAHRPPHWGLYCAGCRDSTERKTFFRNMYTNDEIMDHYQRYGRLVNANEQMRHERMPPEYSDSF
jgi:hypothetical protein